jgi:hypothetical protein
VSDKGSHFSVPPGAEHAGKEGPHPAPAAVARRLAELQASFERVRAARAPGSLNGLSLGALFAGLAFLVAAFVILPGPVKTL